MRFRSQFFIAKSYKVTAQSGTKTAARGRRARQRQAKSAAMKNIAQALLHQPTWRDHGRMDLRQIDVSLLEAAPELLAGADDVAGAIHIIRQAMGVVPGGQIEVITPVEKVIIKDQSLAHVVEKRADQRERFAAYVLPTLQHPTEVWQVGYDDGSFRNRYIKLFSGAKYDLLVMVKVQEDGSVFWNMMQRDRKGMNALRLGVPLQ